MLYKNLSLKISAFLLAGIFCLNLSAAAEKNIPQGASFPVAGKFSTALQKYSGLTWLGNRIASAVACLTLKTKLKGSMDVKVRSFSLTDLLSGRFKVVDMKFRRCYYQDIPLGNISVKTESPFEVYYFNRKKRRRGLGAPILATIEGVVTEQDVSDALGSPKVNSGLRFLKFDLPGLGSQSLQVLEPKVRLTSGKVYLSLWLVTAGAPKESGMSLEIEASPVVNEERYIVLKDVKIVSADIVQPDDFAKFIEELLNPLVDLGRMDRLTHAIRIKNFNVADHEINFVAKVVLAPKPQISPQPAVLEKKK